MSDAEISTLTAAIQSHWPDKPGDKAKVYIGKFFNRSRLGTKITAQVEGNHGIYTVSIQAGERTTSACSCYIGKGGYCHHCAALAATFLKDANSFAEIKPKARAELSSLTDLHDYLKSVSLEELLQELKAKGISQKAFADGIGMNSRHLSAIKSSELRHHYHYELGATKLACLWVLEHFGGEGPPRKLAR